jgi:triacylglycerol lipase
MSVVSAPTKKFHEHIILCKDKHNCLGDLLFVHGYCVDYRYMVADTKLAKHFNYYAINLPAHGDNVENTFINLTLETFADYVISYIEYRKSKGNFKKLILMGHSMGGGIVSIVASKRPDLITHLILICPYNAATLLVGLPGFYIFQPKNMKQKYRLLSYLYKNYNIYMDDPQWVKMNEDQLD